MEIRIWPVVLSGSPGSAVVTHWLDPGADWDGVAKVFVLETQR